MRKNRTKHEAKKPRLAKRALALCFALIFVCSCLLPVFAHSEENLLTQEAVAQQESVDNPTEGGEQQSTDNLTEGGEQQSTDNLTEGGEEPVLLTEGGTDSNEEPKNEEPKPVEPEQKPEEPKVEEQPKTEGATEESKDTTGESKPEEPKTEETKPEGTTEEPKPEEPKPAESKPTTNTTGDAINQGEATYTYRFWRDKIDAFDLEAINDAVKKGESLNEVAQAKAGMVPCTVLTVKINAHLSDYSVTEPTKDGYEFKGWYTIENGTNYDFSLDQNVNDIEESKTIDVFAKWEKVESTVEDEMEKTEPTTEDELEKTEPGKANESKEETLLPVEKTGAVGLTNNEDETVNIAVKAENLPGKVNELVVTDLNEDEEGAAFGNALAASSYKDWNVTNLMVNITPKDAEGKTVEPNEAVTVHFSGLESLMIQYSSEMNLKVLHMKRDGTLEALSLKNVQTKETQEGTVLSSFAVSTTSFSPFVLAASESAGVEPAKLDVGKYPTGDEYTHKDGIHSYRQITVGESIVVSCDGDHLWGPYTWSSDDTSVIEIVSSTADTVQIKAVGTGYATIKHGHLLGGNYTFYVAQSRGTEKASIFFLNKPNANKDSNQWGEWLPSNGNYSWQVNAIDMDGTINTSHAKWSVGDSNAQNKNILLQDTDNASGQYVTEWPDGATTKAWTLYNSQLNRTKPTGYTDENWKLNNAVFTNVLNQMWSGYESYLKTQLGVADLTLDQAKTKITQITLTPYKISNNNDGMHIDCEIGVTGISYEAKFWVKAPGKTVYEQAYGKAYADTNNSVIAEPNGSELRNWKNAHNGTVTLKPDGSLPGSITGENGVSYTLKKWYEEDGDQPSQTKASFPHTPTVAEKYDGIVNFYAEYVADQTVEGPDDPYITVEKKIVGLPSDKVDKLLENFKVNVGGVGGFELTRKSYDFTRDDKADGTTTILRWKINSATAASYHVTESNCDVSGYKVDASGDVNKTFIVENATFTASADVIRSNSSQDFKVGEDGNNQYWVFVVSLTSNGKNVVISSRPLSAGERASIVAAVKNDINGTISNKSTLDNSIFYSITQGKELVLNEGGVYKITYSDYNDKVHGPGIHIEHTNNWNMAASVNYSMTDAKSADIKLTNTYTPATTSLTVTKRVAVGNATAPTGATFNFKLTVGNEEQYYNGVTITPSTNVERKANNEWTFTLQDGHSATISGIRLDDTSVKVEEVEVDKTHYSTKYSVNDGAEADGKEAKVTDLKQNSNTVVFTNTYNVPNLDSMTIKKVVTGAFGERTKDFTFSVKLDNAKRLEVIHSFSNPATRGELSSFTLKHGEYVTLKNIPIGTTITVTEKDAKDYDTKATNYGKADNKTFVYEVVNENGTAVLKSVGTGAEAVKDNAIIVENNFDGNPDTGVLLDTLPYLILLAVAVAGGVLVVVRKRKHRDE